MNTPPRTIHRGPEDRRARENFVRQVRRLRLLLIGTYLAGGATLLLAFFHPFLLLLTVLLVAGSSMVYYTAAARIWRCPFCDHRFHPRNTLLLLNIPMFCPHCGEPLQPAFPEPPPPRDAVFFLYRKRRNLHRFLFAAMLGGALLMGLGFRLDRQSYPATGTAAFLLGLGLLVGSPLVDLWIWRCPHCNRFLTGLPLEDPSFCPYCGIRLRAKYPPGGS